MDGAASGYDADRPWTGRGDPRLPARTVREGVGRRYAIHLWHTDGGFRGLSKAHMYEPIRETLRRGLEARADECGYEVSVTIFKASDGTPRAISDGDVVIYFGSYGFRVPAIGALRDGGVPRGNVPSRCSFPGESGPSSCSFPGESSGPTECLITRTGGVSIIKFETEPGRPPTDGALMPWETPSAKQRGALIENWSYTHAYAWSGRAAARRVCWSRRRRDCDVDIPRRRVAATPRLGRG